MVIPFGRVAREPAPAAADLEHVVLGAEHERVAQPLELRPLGLGQGHLGPLEEGAGIRHRLVEHHFEELVPEVVVVGDVPPCPRESVAAVQARAQLDDAP